MKPIWKTVASLSLLFAGMLAPLQGFSHDVPIHEKVTQTAALNSEGFLDFLTDQLGPNHIPFIDAPKLIFNAGVSPSPSPVDGHSPIRWLRVGSRMEDDEIYTSVPYYGDVALRSKNHFFDPTKSPARGLTDGRDLWAIQSFTWASSPNGSGSRIQNHDTWLDARARQYEAVTQNTKAIRDTSLGHMLYSLGHVLHLNQDLSQPEHTRNDNHNDQLGGKRHIEAHGLRNFTLRPDWFTPPSPSQRGWAYWRAGGFTRLEDFWDRNLYAGTPQQQKQALNDDAISDPVKQLGLAEFSNGNFISEDAVYIDCYPMPPPKHRFAFPALTSSTTFPQIMSSLLSHQKTVYYRDGSSGTHTYIRKTADGIPVPHHSRLTYLWARLSDRGLPVALAKGVTVNDEKVLDDYHSLLLPKAVKYSAGILDYFFRGRLEVSVSRTSGQSQLHIINRSGQQLSGGTFTLYQDDRSGNRTPVSSFAVTWPGTLADGAAADGTFTGTFDPQTKFTLVYQGTIGTAADAAGLPDPVDQGIAIAAQSFTICDWCTINSPDTPIDFEDWTCTQLINDAWGSMAGLSGTYDVAATWTPGYGDMPSAIAFTADEICCPEQRNVTITFNYTAFNEYASYSQFILVLDGVAHYSPFVNSPDTTSGSWTYAFTLEQGTHTLEWEVGSVPNNVGLPYITGTVTIE